MNQVASRIGKTLALVLPVVLVLSGTLAVTRVPWDPQSSEAQVLTASHGKTGKGAALSSAPQEVLRRNLVGEVHRKDPGVALTHLQQAMAARPSLSEHCGSIARSLGRAAVAEYGERRAQRFSRPVCDTSFATGVATSVVPVR